MGSLDGKGLKEGSSIGLSFGKGSGSISCNGFKKLIGQRGRGSAGLDESKVIGREFIIYAISWREVSIVKGKKARINAFGQTSF